MAAPAAAVPTPMCYSMTAQKVKQELNNKMQALESGFSTPKVL